MANISDSLRINDSSSAGSESGHENTEGALNRKVSTIRQADENSEPPSKNDPGQETGLEDTTVESEGFKKSRKGK